MVKINRYQHVTRTGRIKRNPSLMNKIREIMEEAEWLPYELNSNKEIFNFAWPRFHKRHPTVKLSKFMEQFKLYMASLK